MAIQRTALDIHIGRVRVLEQAGIAPPPEWAKLCKTLLDYFTLATPIRDELIAAISAGDTGNIAALRACAIAEMATPNVQLEVNRAVADQILPRLLDLYRPHAAKIYRKVADQFDAPAKLLHGALKICDPDLDAKELVSSADEQRRRAWLEAELHAAELDRLVGIVRCAAELAGASMKSEEMKLALVVDAHGAHRRRVWEEGWRCKDGRTKRRGALIKCGARIRAADLDGLAPYLRPPPLSQNVKTVNGLQVVEMTDPCDAEVQPQGKATA